MPDTHFAVDHTAFEIAKFLHSLDPGPLAELRRMGIETGAPAFWRLHARHEEIQRSWQNWMRITRILAIMTAKGPAEARKDKRLHGKRPFGAVLCDGGDPALSGGRPYLSEARFARLLATRGAQRADHLDRVARMLSRVPGSGIKTGEIAWAILNPNNSHRIASSYYDRLEKMQKSKGGGMNDL